jgi:hypothetical protein
MILERATSMTDMVGYFPKRNAVFVDFLVFDRRSRLPVNLHGCHALGRLGPFLVALQFIDYVNDALGQQA